MPYVSVPKDLSKVKSKIAFNLTKRQLICFGCAAIIGIPTYLFTRKAIGTDGAVFLMIGLMLPFFFLAMYEKDGQPAEKILRNFLRTRFWPSSRVYKTENLYQYLNRQEGSSFEKQESKAASTPAIRNPAGKARQKKRKQAKR